MNNKKHDKHNPMCECMDCFAKQCIKDSEFESNLSTATGAYVQYVFFDDLDQIDIDTDLETFNLESDDIKTGFVSFGDYNPELDRCSLTGIPDDQIFFYSTRDEFMKLYSETSGEDFLLVGEPYFHFENISSGKEKACKDFPMQCIVFLSMPDTLHSKAYGSFKNGGEAFEFIVNSSESHGNFAIVPLRNPAKKRDYHDWWLPDHVEEMDVPKDEWNFLE